MRHLVIGAGATLAEAIVAGVPTSDQPPLISNFAQKVWNEFNPHPFLDRYLESIGQSVENEDGRQLFYELERIGATNIERFFEFAWQNRHRSWEWSDNLSVSGITHSSSSAAVTDRQTALPKDFAAGLTITVPGGADPEASAPTFWDNLMDWGIGRPFVDLMVRAFGENGSPMGFRKLPVAQFVAGSLDPGDLVLNLNYDTVFEIALAQSEIEFTYGPSQPDNLRVAKPHGSLNLVTTREGFGFGHPSWLGMPEPLEGKSYRGFVPPRFNKTYEQHPFARIILKSLRGRHPDEVIFWGVGFTESDADLLALYRAWCRRARRVAFINPDAVATERAGRLLSCSPQHFMDPEEWARSNS